MAFGPRPTEFKSAGNNIYLTYKRQPAQHATAKQEMEKLQGTWKVTATTGSGDGRVKTITFSSNRYSFDSDVPVVTGTLQFVNVTDDPKSFDLTNDSGGTSHAIFRIEGDTLYYAGHGDPKARPTDFTSRPGDGRWGHVCKRVKAQEAAEVEKEKVTALRQELAVKEELVRLHGVWKPISAENDGKELDPKEDDWTLKFIGDKFVQLRRKGPHRGEC